MDKDEDGQDGPKFTKTPNALLDELMPLMKEAELRVTLALMRQTIGFHRERVSLSIADFQRLTGLSRQGVINGIEQGIERGTVVREEDGRGGFFYGLVLVEGASQRSRLVNLVDYHEGSELVNLVDQGSQLSRLASQLSRPVLVNLVDQYTPVLKKKEIGWLDGSLPSTRKKKKPTNQPPVPARLPEMEQLALDLITDGEVGIEYEAAKILASKLPALEIFRAVDGWLDDRERGVLRKPSAVLFKRLDALAKHPPKRPPETVKLSSDFLGSDLFHRHRLPDELLAAPRDRRYNRPEDYTDIDLDSEQRRRKYRPDKYADIILG